MKCPPPLRTCVSCFAQPSLSSPSPSSIVMSLDSLLNPTEGPHSKLQVTPSCSFLLPESVGPQHTPSETPQYWHSGAQIVLDNIDFHSASEEAGRRRRRNADATRRHRHIKQLEAQVAQLQMENQSLKDRCHVLERSLDLIRGIINHCCG